MIPLRDIIPSRTFPIVTVCVLVLNTLVFLFQSTLDPDMEVQFVYAFGLVPSAFSAVNVVTSMFVHGGLLHFAGNMLYLWIFGDNVEDRMGHGRFVVFYLLCGTAAAAGQTLAAPASALPMVGASGAIAGVMGAYLVLYPQSRVLTLFPFPLMVFEVPAVFLLGLWFVAQFLSGLGTPAGDALGGIAFWAHVMGFVAGVVLVFVFRRPERQRVEWWNDVPVTRRR
ncbi:MAG: rhomboid family intramembrane serine protease [Vicinamibacterales bacterium]|nr:rhomboid family intramembrane serine protease [Vicinamibacterales bacterium]